MPRVQCARREAKAGRQAVIDAKQGNAEILQDNVKKSPWRPVVWCQDALHFQDAASYQVCLAKRLVVFW